MSASFLDKKTTTSMKAFAILLVVISHIGDGGFHLRMFVPLGGFGVAIFLVLSGYGLMESYKRNGLEGFWKKRLMRIVIPFFVWVCAVSAYNLLSSNSIPLSRGWYWFVEYIIIWYVVFYLAMKFFPRQKWIVFICAAILIFCFMSCGRAQHCLSFIAGVFISEYKKSFTKIEPRTMLMIGVSLLLVGVVAFGLKQWMIVGGNGLPMTGTGNALVTRNIGDDEYIVKFLQIFAKLPVALFFIIILEQFAYKKPLPLYHIGLAAYELYLVHMPFFERISCSIPNLLIFCIGISIATFSLYWCDKQIIGFLQK